MMRSKTGALLCCIAHLERQRLDAVYSTFLLS